MKLPLVILIGIFSILILGYSLSNYLPANSVTISSTPQSSPTPIPSPIILKQAIPQDAYTIILVGDSMTESLGPNTDQLSKDLKEHYPNKTFGIFNLGKGSTNILSLQPLLENNILNREFEVILIESFGYNPLSDLPLEEGLSKQTEALDKAVNSIRTAKQKAKVNSIIVFVATIAPNKDKYGEGQVDLSKEQREKWVNERIAYIKNHMQYAKDHNIPLINIYDKSLDREKITGDLQYIEAGSHIHPSKKGIELISKEIADFLYNEKILLP